MPARLPGYVQLADCGGSHKRAGAGYLGPRRSSGDAGHALRQGRPLSGAGVPCRQADAPAAPRGAERQLPFRACLLARGVGGDRGALAGRHQRMGAGGGSALFLRRHDGLAAATLRLRPLLPADGGQPPGAHDLLRGRVRRLPLHDRFDDRDRAGGFRARPPDPDLGQQHADEQPAPVAVHPGGAQARRAGGGHRPRRARARPRPRTSGCRSAPGRTVRWRWR